MFFCLRGRSEEFNKVRYENVRVGLVLADHERRYEICFTRSLPAVFFLAALRRRKTAEWNLN